MQELECDVLVVGGEAAGNSNQVLLDLLVYILCE